MIKIRAAIYVRKSRLSEKGESINNQIDLCKKYFSNLQLDIYIEFSVYQDEGFSGGNTNRPEFQKLIRDIKKKRFNYLICYKLDRISRNVADFTSTLKILEENNVNFISITEQFDTTSVMGRAMINISATFAQMERETIAERIRDNMLELSKTGRWLGGTCPLGFKSTSVNYESNGHKKKMYKLQVVDNEMNIVKLIFNLYIKKKSCSPIARYLCSNGIKGKNGGDFSRNTVLQILTNPVYCTADKKALDYFKNLGATIEGNPNSNCGIMAYNKRKNGKKDNPINEWIISTGAHIGVIPSTQWIQCQNILDDIRKKPNNRTGTGSKFLLSGLLRCTHCNSSMCSWSRNNPNGKYERYYRCELKNRSSNRCICKMLNADKAESFIIDLLKNLDVKTIENYKNNSTIENASSIERKKTMLNKTLNENNKIISGLIKKLALLDDMDILNTIQNEIKNLKTENETIEKNINDLSIKSFVVEDEKENKKALIENLNLFKKTIDFIDDIEVKRSMIKNLVEYFTYNSQTKQIKFKLRRE
ncbi:MAG: recombinase family protein [Clostridium septicum]|uniref:recombinase family protein n=1 Tax=Clostridium septicum TaxID=1504 RepID=UPI00258BFBCB|nr:recombinase family protein [Clostridium septicum]MDU1315280.1 recombinase family protein [Clostridium septicum]